MIITVPKMLQLMSCGSRIESYVCLPAKPTLWPLSLMSTPSPVRKMEANVWFAHSPARVEEEGLRLRLLLLPLEGPLCLQFALLHHPKRGPLGRNQSNLTPCPPCHPQVCLEFKHPESFPWPWLFGDSLKSEAGSRGKVLISYALCVLLSMAAYSGSSDQANGWSARPSGHSGRGERGESLWAQQE